MIEPSPHPRRISTPRWLDLRLVLGVVLVLGSVLIGASVVSGASDTHGVVTATHDLAAGTILRAGDLHMTQVQLPDDGRGVYLDDPDDAVGRMLDRAVERDALVPAEAVAEVGPRTTLTVPFASDAAPELRAGQRIEVWLSSPRCAFVVLLPDVTVQSVRSADAGSLRDPGTGQNVVISIEPALAPRVVAAQSIEDAQLRAGVLTGTSRPVASSPSPSPSASPSPTGSGPAVAGLPADLAACAGSSGR